MLRAGDLKFISYWLESKSPSIEAQSTIYVATVLLYIDRNCLKFERVLVSPSLQPLLAIIKPVTSFMELSEPAQQYYLRHKMTLNNLA